MLKVISKRYGATFWNVAESQFTKTRSKSLWNDENLVKHTNTLLNDSDAKCLNQQERLALCLKSFINLLNAILRQVFVRNIGQKLFLPSWQASFLKQERSLRGWRLSMGIFPFDLEQVYGIVIERKLRQTGLPVILCQFWSSLFRKQDLWNITCKIIKLARH